jgi:shikimate dehydrogenase
MERRITGTTQLLGLIGSPVEHSKSPEMHNFSFQKTGSDYAYLAFDILIEKVPDAIAAIKTLHMRGGNVTMPCKREVAKYMDDLSPAAKIVGAVNTIVNDHGKLTGHITDGVGFVSNLKTYDVDPKGKKFTIFGAGGAATAIEVQVALDGAKSITIFNKKDQFYANAEDTVKKIKQAVPNCAVALYPLDDSDRLKKELAETDVLVNATLIGMAPHEKSTLIEDKSLFHPGLVVADTVYSPKTTRLLTEAEAAGCRVIGGLGMLLWQGAEAFKLFSGKDMPVKEVNEIFFS